MRPSRPRPRALLEHGPRALAGVVLGLVIAEAAFWVRDGGAFPHLNVYIDDAERGVRLRPGATERIRFSKNPVTKIRINADGFRGGPAAPPSPDEVIVVGDSQVFGLGVEEDETFAAVLQSTLGGSRIVRNLGVPTYGPDEYTAVLAAALAKRPAGSKTTVVYVMNMANDLFEASRPNRDRHAVWDGWAVRKETAPASVTNFPGRAFLFQRSHAFYALRRFLYDRGPKIDDRGFASEGTWRDIEGAATSANREHLTAEEESARLARLRDSELRYASAIAGATQDNVDRKVFELNSDQLFGRNEPEAKVMDITDLYRASSLSPGDIVTVSFGESGRDVRVTAAQIRRGAELRLKYETETRARAEAKKDAETLALFQRRDALKQRESDLKVAPPPKVLSLSPLAPAIQRAKTLCDTHGARLLVVALPIDVQVSPSEWAKYGAAPVDMEPSKVLLEDVVIAARIAGAEGVDVTPALAAAEPGAFLDGDIHMTPKGHRALGEAIAGVLAATPLTRPGDALPASRSWPPRPEEWTPTTEIVVRESDPAGCETKRVREWLGVFCRNLGGAKSVTVAKGREVMAGAMPGQAVLVAPLIRGQNIRATFDYGGFTRELSVDVADKPETAVIAFSKPATVSSGPGEPASAHVDALCKCFSAASNGEKCSNARVAPDADCARTYPRDCAKLLACAAGDPAFAPRCAEGSAPAGAAHRCALLCSSERPCAKGECMEWQGGRVCL